MKSILFTIPHYYKRNSNSPYGSGREVEDSRIKALSMTIKALINNFNQVKIIICTSGKDHLIDKLPKNIRKKIDHQPRNPKNPMYLGFECQDILSENIKKYDFFCYLEDDLIIEDKKFFDKLKLFNEKFGNSFLLQPNRFEYNKNYNEKYYLDKVESNWKKKTISLKSKNKKINFINSYNVHSGCFFLNKIQMNKLIKSKFFRKRTDKYIGPLESAASYSILKNFKIYKPSLLNRNWLEIKHFGDRYLQEYIIKAGDSIFYYFNRLKKIFLSKKFWRCLFRLKQI